MCMAAPSKVIEVNGQMAVTECFGQRREVSLMLLTDDVKVGDYLLIQAGGFAFECIEAPQAEEILGELEDLLAVSGDEDVRPLGSW